MNIQKDDLKAWKDNLKLVEYLLFQIKTKKKVQETNQEKKQILANVGQGLTFLMKTSINLFYMFYQKY